jgi:hypothetical protein
LLAVGAVAADQIYWAPASAAIAQKHDLIGKTRAQRPARLIFHALSRHKNGRHFPGLGEGKKKAGA